MNTINKTLLMILLWSSIATASSYPDSGEVFLSFMGISFGISGFLYVVLGFLFVSRGSLKPMHMVPFFIVMLGSVMMTLFEVGMRTFMPIYIGGTLLGSSISSAIYLYLVKKKLNEGSNDSNQSGQSH